MIPHPTLSCFGASPDGINELGIMVEIKTPYRRRVDGNIPYEYMIQMQGQMAVCGLTECDFVDAEIYFNYKCIEEYINDSDILNMIVDHGIVVEYIDYNNYDSTPTSINRQYIYSPVYLTAKECLKWAEEIRASKNTQCLILPWKLVKIIIKRVYFNQEVWNELIPQITQFWSEVINLRNAGVETLVVKKSTKKSTSTSTSIKAQYVPQFIDSDDDMEI
jgi:hypothetical protein